VYKRFQQWVLIIRTGVGLWLEHNAFLHAGALAFFTLFSLAPILIIAVTVIGVVLGESAAQGRIVAELEGAMGVDAAVLVEQVILASRIDEAGLMPCGSRKREPIDPIAHSRVMVDPAIHDPADPIHADFGV